jgi:hypothetical protein
MAGFGSNWHSYNCNANVRTPELSSGPSIYTCKLGGGENRGGGREEVRELEEEGGRREGGLGAYFGGGALICPKSPDHHQDSKI